MKKKIFITMCLGLLVLIISSCKTGTYTTHSGKEDIAYLQFVSSTSLAGKTVYVELDNGVYFNAKVNKERKAYNKPDLYTIQPGKRSVKVTFNNRVIYDSDIFVSQQSTKVIHL